jgi:DUF971 family protein
VAVSADPKNIEVSLSSGVRIDWKDGHRSEYKLDYLRDHCPCASCRNAPTKSQDAGTPFPMFKRALRMNGVEPVGRYALRFLWNDGHTTGIYSFEHLREICPCDECRSKRS